MRKWLIRIQSRSQRQLRLAGTVKTSTLTGETFSNRAFGRLQSSLSGLCYFSGVGLSQHNLSRKYASGGGAVAGPEVEQRWRSESNVEDWVSPVPEFTDRKLLVPQPYSHEFYCVVATVCLSLTGIHINCFLGPASNYIAN